MNEYTDEDYARARTIITVMNDAELLKSHRELPEEDYLHLWNTMLKLQNKLKEKEHA